QVVTKCTKLRGLNISCCFGLIGIMFDSQWACCELRTLAVGSNGGFRSNVIKIACSLPKLKYLYIDYLEDQIPKTNLMEIGKCLELRHLNISGCSEFDLEVLQVIASKCSKLESVHVEYDAWKKLHPQFPNIVFSED